MWNGRRTLRSVLPCPDRRTRMVFKVFHRKDRWLIRSRDDSSFRGQITRAVDKPKRLLITIGPNGVPARIRLRETPGRTVYELRSGDAELRGVLGTAFAFWKQAGARILTVKKRGPNAAVVHDRKTVAELRWLTPEAGPSAPATVACAVIRINPDCRFALSLLIGSLVPVLMGRGPAAGWRKKSP